MPTRLQVTCINKTDSYSPHERISCIGGSGWKHAERDAISYITEELYSYYVVRSGYTVNVIVAERFGRKYLKTENDEQRPDNLLGLPECP